MPFDEGLADRLRSHFRPRSDVEEKKMFGGLCFMVANHMCCGITGDTLIVRVGPDAYRECLRHEHAREMDFTGKAMKGLVYVDPEGLASDEDLARWVGIAMRFIESLPPRA